MSVGDERVGGAGLGDETAAELDRARRLAMVADALAADVTFSDLVEIIVRQATVGSQGTVGLLATLDGEGVEIVASHGLAADLVDRFRRIPLTLEVPLTAAARGEEVYCGSRAERIARFGEHGTTAAALEATVALPVVFGGSVLGALAVGWVEPYEFDEPDQRYLQTLASLVAQTFHRLEAQRRSARFQALAEEEAAIVSTLLASAPVGFALFDHELRFQRVNHRMAEMNGFRVDEHLGRGAFELLPELRETAEPLLRHVLDTGEPLVDVEIAGETPAAPGVERQWMESFFAVRREDGESIGIAAVATEITERKRLERELRAATVALEERLDAQGTALAQLQRMLLPTLPEVDGLTIEARYQTAERIARVGGDWYDAFTVSDGRVVVAVGDAVGHGLPAVTTMDLVRNVLRGVLLTGGGLRDALRQASRALGATSEDFATAALVLLDPRSGDAEYAVAGHPPPLVHRRADGRAEPLPVVPGRLLGPVPPVHGTRTTRLAPGDQLVLYTDGLVERRGSSIDAGLARLGEAVLAERDVDAVLDRMLGGPGQDDTCLLIVTKQ